MAIDHLSTMCQAFESFFYIKLIRFDYTYYDRNGRIGWLAVTSAISNNIALITILNNIWNLRFRRKYNSLNKDK